MKETQRLLFVIPVNAGVPSSYFLDARFCRVDGFLKKEGMKNTSICSLYPYNLALKTV
jgi:hypothetical protein